MTTMTKKSTFDPAFFRGAGGRAGRRFRREDYMQLPVGYLTGWSAGDSTVVHSDDSIRLLIDTPSQGHSAHLPTVRRPRPGLSLTFPQHARAHTPTPQPNVLACPAVSVYFEMA